MRQRFSEGCSSGSATLDTEMGDLCVHYSAQTPNQTISATTGNISYGSQSLSATGRGSMQSVAKPNSSTLLAGFLIREREQETLNAERSSVGIYRKRSVITKHSEHERRATFPSGSSPETSNNKDMGSTLSGLKPQISAESTHCYGLSASNAIASTASTRRPNSSFSSGNLSARHTHRTMNIAERKSKSEERQTSHDNDAFDTEAKGIFGTAISLPSTTHTSATLLDSSSVSKFPTPQPPKIPINRKVIIVDAKEIYDCLDLNRRIDVCWPNEQMRKAGGRQSWKDWEPKEGMVGFFVHYWQPNHPNQRFRSNFNRTLFLIQIGEHFVPVSESGVKEYNTIGVDDRFRTVTTFDPIESSTEPNSNETTCDESVNNLDDTKSIKSNKIDQDDIV